MRLLIDACISHRVVTALRAAGHDAAWAGDLPPGTSDRDVLHSSFTQDRTLITLDKDFGGLVVREKRPQAGIIRLVNIPRHLQVANCVRAIQDRSVELLQGAILTVTPNRIRVRFPPGGRN